MQQHNNLKHSSQSITEWLKKENNQGVAMVRSPNLNLAGMLWKDLRALRKQILANLNELSNTLKNVNNVKTDPKCKIRWF